MNNKKVKAKLLIMLILQFNNIFIAKTSFFFNCVSM